MDVPFREIVGGLMWIANQRRPTIANVVRDIALFPHDAKPTVQAADTRYSSI